MYLYRETGAARRLREIVLEPPEGPEAFFIFLLRSCVWIRENRIKRV